MSKQENSEKAEQDDSKKSVEKNSAKIEAALQSLKQEERLAFERAARGPFHGGDPIGEPYLARALELKLVFSSSGCLKPLAYQKLHGDTPTIVAKSWY